MKATVIKAISIAIAAFGVFLAIIFMILNDVPVKRNGGSIAFTETRLFKLKQPKHYDVLIVGSSRAILFTEHVNNDSIEIILGKTVTNIAHVGAGIIPMNVMLRYFYESGNTADHIIRFVDTHEFYSKYANEQCDFLKKEPFDLKLLSIAYEEGMAPKKFFPYAQSKYRYNWLNMASYPPGYRFIEAMEHIDSNAISQRMEIIYPDGADMERFTRYKKDFQSFIDLVTENNSNLSLFLPPHLLGPQPGHTELISFLDSLQLSKGIPYYDHSHSLEDISMFSNHDHLNTKGTVHVMHHYLKPIIDHN